MSTLGVAPPHASHPRPMPIAPLAYRGTISGFIAQHLDPMLPEAPAVDAFHRALVDYVRRPDALFLVRGVTGTERRSAVTTDGGVRLMPTDNSPAWWWHALLLGGATVDGAGFAQAIGRTPVHMFDVPRGTNLNTAGWHAAHVLGAKDRDTTWRSWSRATVVRRFVRNIHPCNLFYVPLTDWPRTGADPRLIAATAAHLRRRYASVWEEFSALAQAPVGHGATDSDGPLVIAPPPTTDATAATSQAGGHRTAVKRGATLPGLWGEVLAGGPVPPVGALLASHPHAAAATGRLLEGLTVECLVAIADALHNRCRPSDMAAMAPGQPARQAQLAWDALVVGARRTDRRPSGWTGTIRLLHPGSDQGLSVVTSLGIGGVARVCARIVNGPYRRACEAGLR